MNKIFWEIIKKFIIKPNICYRLFGIRTKGKRPSLLSSNRKEVNSMEQSSSYNKETIQHQFDRKCKLALQGEKIDYERYLSYRQKHEILFCELPKTEFWKLSAVDEYTAESYFLADEQFDVKIKNELLAKAIETLTERKKEVIFLSYFQGMSDAAIARKLNLVRSTVCEHRTRSLELLKNTMEEYGYENYR